MYIKNLFLHNFRNYREQKVEFDHGINLLIGPNAQGKTNALEAIYYLITGKSYRVRKENELILWGAKNFYLKSTFKVQDLLLNLESYYEPNKKIMKINQVPCRRLSDYVGTVNAVFFSPDDLEIIKNSPTERRRFLDLLISQLKPSHIALLNSYLKVLRQKKSLLRREIKTRAFKEELLVWNQQLVDIGSKIILNRLEFTKKLNEYALPIFQSIFPGDNTLELVYYSLNRKDIEGVLADFSAILENKMAQEIERKTILVGPHRDDLLIEINGRPARSFASQGQQRVIVLCLKMAEMEIILNEKGEYPILLLDDVLSELDGKRRQYLLEYIYSTRKQTIITMTEADDNIESEQATIFQVLQGKIRRCN
ncbi:MAG: DNA replication/repair protein RecF [Peptococcaceae bacterium]|nr:DNA replication/repair protein RecF [Peptococcaceae bacterium]